MGMRLDQPPTPSRFWEGEGETTGIFLFLLGPHEETSTRDTEDLIPPTFLLTESQWGSPLLAKSPQRCPSSHRSRFRDAAARSRGRRPSQPQGAEGCPKRTSNRITSLRMTAEIRSKSLSYCVTRDSHCGDRKCTVSGQGKELLPPSPWGFGATTVHVRCCWSRAWCFQSLSPPWHGSHRRRDHEQPLLQLRSRLA